MSSIKGIRNLTGLSLKLVPHRKLNGRQGNLPQILCQMLFALRENTKSSHFNLTLPKESNHKPLELM